MSHPVTALFDDKASAWGSKYRRGGPLEQRRARFMEALTSRILPGAPLLELGCGAGDLAAALAERRYEVRALDVSQRMLDAARARFPDAQVGWGHLASDWKTLPLPDASVQGVLASSVLEYVEDVGQVFREVARVLEPGGWFLFTVPDMTHPGRWLESAARGVFSLGPTARAAQRSSRLSGFLRYLSVSRNRFSLEGWRAQLQQAGLPPRDAPLSLGPLQLIFARRRWPGRSPVDPQM